jgi:uncharacterized protein
MNIFILFKASMVDSSPHHSLTRVIDQLAHRLPAQGPISIFIHHNTLHAFEHLPSRTPWDVPPCSWGANPSSPNRGIAISWRPAGFARKRRHAARRATGCGGGRGCRRRRIPARSLASRGASRHSGREWAGTLLDPGGNGGAVPFPHRCAGGRQAALAALCELNDRVEDERRAVHRLWNACLDAVGRADRPRPGAPEIPVRDRDWLLAVHGFDIDAWINPPLIRFLAGYLDQGLAHWSMPDRDRGIHGCFLEIYRAPAAAQ